MDSVAIVVVLESFQLPIKIDRMCDANEERQDRFFGATGEGEGRPLDVGRQRPLTTHRKSQPLSKPQAIQSCGKSWGGIRKPTSGNRCKGGTIVVTRIGAELYGVFHPDSHGYQLNKSAVNAIANTRERCWEYDWVVEFDIRRAFDELNWSLLRKAIAKHVKDPWCLLYIER